MVALVSTASAIGWAAADDRSEQPAGTYFFPVEVPLVSVDAVVTDRSGAPIPNLTEADFEVFEDGEAVEISHFFAAQSPPEDRDEPGAPSALSAAPDQELHLALYIDDLDTDTRRRATVLSHLREFLEQPMPPNIRTMLVRFDGELRVVSDFADDADHLLAGLDELRNTPVISPMREEQELFRLMQAATTDQRDEINQWMTTREGPFDSEGGGGRPEVYNEPDNRPMYQDFLPQIHAYARSKQQRGQASLEALRRFVAFLNAIPGRKAVIWVGGLDTRPGEDLFLSWQELMLRASQRGAVSPMMEARQYDLTHELDDVLEIANSQRVSFYTVSSLSAGLERISSTEGRGRDSSRVSTFSDLWREEDALTVMSATTGGRMLVDNRDLDQQLMGVASELRNYYSLGYTPPTPGDNEYHKIVVKVRRDDARVRHRHGYRDPGARNPMTDRILAAATVGFAENPLGIALEARSQEKRSEGEFLVPVTITIPIGSLSLAPHKDHHTAQVALYSVVRDDRGRLSAVHERIYPIEVANSQLAAAVAERARFVLGMVLRKGPQRIAVSVQDRNSMLESTAFIEVDVGADPDDGTG